MVQAQNGQKAWSKEEILKNVRTGLLIDGKFVPSKSGKTFKTINPVGRSAVRYLTAPLAPMLGVIGDKADVDAAVAAARTAFDKGPWPRMTGAQRARVINKFADLLEANLEELAHLETLDNGKPLAMARAIDIPVSVKHFRYFAGWADKVTGRTIPLDGMMFGYTLREPIGVIGAVIPWNFPALMLTMKVASSLATGNTLVVKVAEQTPLTAARYGELALDAGLPPGVLNIIQGYGPTAGAALVNHPDVDKISFTGSTEVGRIVGAAAGNNIKPVTLELGGKSAAIVWKDVDVGQAAEAAFIALQFNMGQCCTAGSRTFVHEDVYDEFVERTVELAKKRTVGDPFAGTYDQGPQVDAEQFDKIMSYIHAGKEAGATLKHGGKRVGNKGYFIEPTVFADVKDDMTIAMDEIFGPVQAILKYKTLAEVLERANKSDYGLAAGIWAKDVSVINTLSRGLKAGTVWCNCYNIVDAAMPFGGYKASGVGRDSSEEALHACTQVKAVYQKLEESAWL